MNKEKQIEEMAEILVNGCKMGGCEECEYSKDVFPKCTLKYTADQLYNADYRKASELVEEIFAEIESCIWSETLYGDSKLCFEVNSAKYAELKNKYTENKGE